MKAHRFAAYTAIVLALVLLAATALDVMRRRPDPPDVIESIMKTTVPPDTVPPEIHGVQDLETALYGTLAYRRGVSVTDDAGEATLEVDSADVNTDAPGEYTVVYIARDAAGNETRVAAKVTVLAVSEKEVALLADPILEEIIGPGASDEEKALAIHTWVKANITYTNTGDKNSVLEGAYNGLTLHQGDCYTFYALAKYLLDRVGIESIDMHRVPEAETRHYWLALDLGGGWHHYDACPVTQDFGQYRAHGGFMMTDGEAQEFANGPIDRPDYYTYDPAELPEGVEIVE